MGDHYAQHDNAPYLHDAAGVPWTAAYIQATGDPIADLHEDMAAEQKARTAYEHLINLTDDAGVIAALSFLREREVVHFQRFGETLMLVRESGAVENFLIHYNAYRAQQTHIYANITLYYFP